MIRDEFLTDSRGKVLVFSVPGEARGQSRPRATIRGGHASVYERAEDKSYKGLIQMYAMQEMKEKDITPPIKPDGLGITVSICVVKVPPKSFSKKKRKLAYEGAICPLTKPDLDNIAKIYLDALNGVVWHDDSQVQTLTISKVYGDNPHVLVMIHWLESESDSI